MDSNNRNGGNNGGNKKNNRNLRSVLSLIGWALVLTLVFNYILAMTSGGKSFEITYSQMMNLVQEDQIKKIELKDGVLYATPVDGYTYTQESSNKNQQPRTYTQSEKNPITLYTTYLTDTRLLPLLDEHGVEYSSPVKSSWSVLGDILVMYILPMLLTMGLIVLVMRIVSKNGGGIGGMECALVLKQRGHKPVIFEKTNELGGLFLTASAMSFKENDKELIEWYKKEVEKQGIDIRFNTEVTDLGTMRGFDEIIVATGSVPRTMPMIPGFEKTLSFTELLKDKKEVGDKVLFIGGGQSSCEAAYDLVLQGKHPIIVEYAGDLVAAQATCLANTSFLRDAMEYHKVPTYLHSTITAIRDGSVTVKGPDGKTFDVECDNVVNGIGFVPAPVGEKGRHVHRVGDCVAIGNLRTVIWRAWDVCMKI